MALAGGTLSWFNAWMFIGAEVRLNIGFSAAQARLANLTSGGVLRHASDDAYRDLGTGLVRVGPLGAAPGMSRLVTVRFGDLAVHADFAVAAMRWEAAGPGGTLFPALDADIRLTRAGPDVTVLAVSGTYRPPLGTLGAGADRVIMHRIAQATIRAFTQQVGTAIPSPATSPEAARSRRLPEPPPWPDPETP
jgi:hypothetical protein